MNPTVQAIAWTLIHFCWQAAVIAAAFRALSVPAARFTSNTRYLLALGALLLMFAASAATFTWEMRPAFAAAASVDYPAESPVATSNFSPVKTAIFSAVPSIESSPASRASASLSGVSLPQLPLPILRVIDGLWLLGVLTLSLRSLGGWCVIQKLRATAVVEAPAAARICFRRIAGELGIRRPVLLRVSSAITGPVTFGALRAVVLLPLSAATLLGHDELEVVIAHELAHVRRADFLWNLVQTFVETLFFFHPAVWWIGNRIRHERELCCDDMALDLCPNPVVYANALFNLELQRNNSGRFAMALNGHQPARTLRMRIARILGEPTPDTTLRGPFSIAAAAAALVVLLLPVPQLLASFDRTAHVPQAEAVVTVRHVLDSPSTVASAPAVVKADAPVYLDASKQATQPSPSVQAESSSAAPAVSTESAQPQKNETPSGSSKGDYIDRMKAAGYDVDLDKYIAMKVQDITPEYARAMSQLGFGKLSADDLIACKVQDVTPETIADLKRDGLEVKTVQQAISYRIFAVTPEFVAGMKAAGFANLTSEQMIALRTQDVTPEYARSIAQQFPGATADDLVKSRIFNIDAAFIASAKKHGFTDLSFEKLVKLRISGLLDDESDK